MLKSKPLPLPVVKSYGATTINGMTVVKCEYGFKIIRRNSSVDDLKAAPVRTAGEVVSFLRAVKPKLNTNLSELL